ncbi:unnamed protein product [Caenorhabditis angaria]|uniref:Uncharacterized protein n=1 Tax=Caenorhabditis angaria TaxID=860376 RepID=A0A9P1IEA5_9PELO|nr:unnamed protein product [Caenorhabditis angaria]
MGLCCSRKEQKQLDSSLSPKDIQLESSSISQCQTREFQAGWFDLPFELREMIIDMMGLEAKAIFSQCSTGCYEEVARSRNYVDKIIIIGNTNRSIGIFVYAKDELWIFLMEKKSTGFCEVVWWLNAEIHSKITFENQNLIEIVVRYFNCILKRNTKSLKTIEIFIDDFPYNQSNIDNLKHQELEDLTLFKNKNGIDPISSGFVNSDTISRFRNDVVIPNIQLLNSLFKFQSKTRKLNNPKFSLNEFDGFLRCFLIEEILIDQQIDNIILNLEEIDINFDDYVQIIENYTNPGVPEDIYHMKFVRLSNKIENRQLCIDLKENCVLFSQK